MKNWNKKWQEGKIGKIRIVVAISGNIKIIRSVKISPNSQEIVWGIKIVQRKPMSRIKTKNKNRQQGKKEDKNLQADKKSGYSFKHYLIVYNGSNK